MRLINVAFVSLFCLPAFGQQRYQQAFDGHPWLNSLNPAALTTYADSTVSVAGLTARHHAGPWHGISQGEAEREVVADVRSVFRLSPSVTALGSLTYSHLASTDAQGSMLYDDGRLKPFDIVEDSLANAGDKQRQHVSLCGSLGWSLGQHLSLGARMDYEAATFAKFKDLRHTNTFMHMQAIVGAFMPALAHGHLDLGLHLSYVRQTESIEFQTYGSSDQVYKTLIDYANLTGSRETFGGEGFTDSRQELPLLTERMGGSVQLGVHLSPSICWLSEASWMRQQGYYGRESQYTISYARWTGHDASLTSRLICQSSVAMHQWGVDLDVARLSAQRNVYSQQKRPDNPSVTYYHYYAPVKMNDKALRSCRVYYQGFFARQAGTYRYKVCASTEMTGRDQTAYLYPYYRRQDIRLIRHSLSAERCFPLAADRFLALSTQLSTQHGRGDVCQDGLLAGIAHRPTPMAQQQAYLLQEHEYLTRRQWSALLGLRYSWSWRQQPRIRPVFALAYGVSHAPDPTYVQGSGRQTWTIGAGCEF